MHELLQARQAGEFLTHGKALISNEIENVAKLNCPMEFSKSGWLALFGDSGGASEHQVTVRDQVVLRLRRRTR
jgi:hypothetical protein